MKKITYITTTLLALVFFSGCLSSETSTNPKDSYHPKETVYNYQLRGIEVASVTATDDILDICYSTDSTKIYAAGHSNGVHIINKSTLEIEKTVSIESGLVHDIKPLNTTGFYIAAVQDKGVYILQENNSTFEIVTSYLGINALSVTALDSSNSFAVASGDDGLTIFDFNSNINILTQKSQLKTGGYGSGIFYSTLNSSLYLASTGRGVDEISISDLENPSITTSYTALTDAHDVIVTDKSLLVVAGRNGGVYFKDLTTGTETTVKTNSEALGVATYSNSGREYVVVADGSEGIVVIDIDSTDNIQYAVYADTPGFAHQIHIENDYAYVSDSNYGLRQMNLSSLDISYFANDIVLNNRSFYGVSSSDGSSYNLTFDNDGKSVEVLEDSSTYNRTYTVNSSGDIVLDNGDTINLTGTGNIQRSLLDSDYITVKVTTVLGVKKEYKLLKTKSDATTLSTQIKEKMELSTVSSFTSEWLEGKVIYNVVLSDSENSSIGSVETFSFLDGEVTGDIMDSYEVINNQLHFINDDTYHEITSSTKDYLVVDNSSRFYLDKSLADAYGATLASENTSDIVDLSNVTSFSYALLNGITTYHLPEGSFTPVKNIWTLNSFSGYEYFSSDSWNGIYTIDNGKLVITDEDGTSSLQIVDSTTNYFTVDMGDNEIEKWFFSETQMEAYLNSIGVNKTNFSGVVNFLDDNGNSSTTPNDFGVRITSHVETNNNVYYKGLEGKGSSNGSFSLTNYVKSENYSSNNSFQIIVYKDTNGDGNWNCGEDSYKYLEGSYNAWESIDVKTSDYLDRSGESCSDSSDLSSVTSFSSEWLDGKTFYQVIVDEHDNSYAVGDMETLVILGNEIRNDKGELLDTFTVQNGVIIGSDGSEIAVVSSTNDYLVVDHNNRWYVDKSKAELYASTIEPVFTYGTITSSITGRIWIDRNLGATQACTSASDTSCYGDYYQWGRDADGHEKSNSEITTDLSDSITPTHSNFIQGGFGDIYGDWTSSDNDGSIRIANWNPCPSGFRIPTGEELFAEKVVNSEDAFTKLKLPLSGIRNGLSGSFEGIGTSGSNWSTDKNGDDIVVLRFSNSWDNSYPDTYDSYYLGSDNRSYGVAIRCIQE